MIRQGLSLLLLSSVGAIDVELRKSSARALPRAFHANPGVSHRRSAVSGGASAAACRRTRLYSLSDAGESVLRLQQDVGLQEQTHQVQPRMQASAFDGGSALSADKLHVQEVPINPLKFNGVGAAPHGKAAVWKSHLSHVLDGISALFSLGCVSCTLACMGILEWSTLATMVLFVGSFSTAMGSLMVLATAAVSVMAIIDTLRTGRDKHAASDLEEDALNALAAPPRRLGSMNGRRDRGGGKKIEISR